MIVIHPTALQRKQAKQEAKDMGVLHGSLTKGRCNAIGMMGEILVHELIGGTRVGEINYDYDIVTKNKFTVDVKTTKASAVPEPHYVARVYGSEAKKEKLTNKCDAYYFVRCNEQLTLATIVGWLPSVVFFDTAIFLPRGNVDPSDGKLSFSDEFTIPITELYDPAVKITKKSGGR